ncbi:hypothetical protein A3E46_01215 [Candidatus Woesebacteria bacterium RIFCSPHIGHO2_12_FULL_46_16]|uniref:Uncharacterized protein n=1 Tax=Candidatus Woesebacteria bacterium RIFCSPHIGHO2_12_FULL_46_16 TaxID=1802513 RepID=A0A1F8AYY4_9BACT|nr:MAG: hypothetical protein A3E46_01215 [Candidatus Woesebacteria bacterium RIFCSPHIGHO2_12_FULL_46_16]
MGKFARKIYGYAKGDVKTKICLFPGKGFWSHNIKDLSVFGRYIAGLSLLFFSANPPFLYLLILGILLYGFWAFRKIYSECRNWRVSLWDSIIQIVSDSAVMSGFIKGIIS